jgi:glycosyltransferase involved in cell wall biosynthesis
MNSEITNSSVPKLIRSIAIIDPIGDYGIGGYVYELAEGLASNGVEVDVYTNGLSQMKDLGLPRHHRLLPVLGGVLFRQGKTLKGTPARVADSSDTGGVRLLGEVRGVPRRPGLVTRVVDFLLPFELALYLKKRRYDLIWTQWPVMTRYGVRFWAICKMLGLRLVHTVHNVVPHEEDHDPRMLQRVYQHSDTLIIHSEYSRQELVRLFPKCNRKTLLMRCGMYTMFPRIQGEMGEIREKLGIPKEAPVLLFYGSVRPYKNIDAVLESLADQRSGDSVLIVAGRESGYPDVVHGDPLGRTRRIASSLGVFDRVRLLPGLLDLKSTSELFEMADVLLLPYLKSYGSGVLLLGMTFGMHIVATRTGGMEEYLAEYPAHTFLDGPDTESVAQGIERALRGAARPGVSRQYQLPNLDWRTIGAKALRALDGHPAIG